MDFCEIVISSEKDDILEFNKYMKSDKIPYISYADMECLIRKISGCASNSESSSTKKKQVSIILVAIQCQHTLYRGKDCIKKR